MELCHLSPALAVQQRAMKTSPVGQQARERHRYSPLLERVGQRAPERHGEVALSRVARQLRVGGLLEASERGHHQPCQSSLQRQDTPSDESSRRIETQREPKHPGILGAEQSCNGPHAFVVEESNAIHRQCGCEWWLDRLHDVGEVRDNVGAVPVDRDRHMLAGEVGESVVLVLDALREVFTSWQLARSAKQSSDPNARSSEVRC